MLGLYGGEAGVGLKTLPPHEFEDSPDLSEDVFVDKQEQMVTICPNLAISEIILMSDHKLNDCLCTGMDNNAALLKLKLRGVRMVKITRA